MAYAAAAALLLAPYDLAELRRWERSSQLPGVRSRPGTSSTSAPPATATRSSWPSSKQVARGYPRRQLHMICDNYATHKHPVVRGWLAKHPRIRLHFTPTSASWLNLVEVFFSIVERQALRRGDFASVSELITAISRLCAAWNQHGQPLAWTKPADDILARLNHHTPQ